MSMKVVYMGIWHSPSIKDQDAVELCNERDLSSFNRFARRNVNEFMNFFGSVVAKESPAGARLAITDEKLAGYLIHSYDNTRGLCAIMVTNNDYPPWVITAVLKKICDEFSTKHSASTIASAPANSLPYPQLREYFVQYQNPQEADKILKIQKELDDTKQVLYQTMDSLLERGEKMDQLVAKSNDLSASSKLFYTQAKKQNSCCVVM